MNASPKEEFILVMLKCDARLPGLETHLSQKRYAENDPRLCRMQEQYIIAVGCRPQLLQLLWVLLNFN